MRVKQKTKRKRGKLQIKEMKKIKGTAKHYGHGIRTRSSVSGRRKNKSSKLIFCMDQSR